MAEYPAGKISRAGEGISLFVDDDGNWITTVANLGLKQPTRAKLISDIDRVLRLKKKAVHIPVTIHEGKNNGYITLKHGVITGVHGSSGNLLISYDDGTNGQVTGYGLELMKRLLPEDENELRKLTRQAYEAAEKLREFTSRHRIYQGENGLKKQVGELLAKGDGK